MIRHWRRLAGVLALIVFLAVLPWVLTSAFYIDVVCQILIYALLALSLDILIGHGGMISLGQAVYLGVPAYVYAWLIINGYANSFWAALAALAGGILIAAFFGVLSLRARGLGFLMITLALGQVVWGLSYRWEGLTGGDNGIRLESRPMPFGISFNSPIAFYYVIAVVFLLGVLCIWQLMRSTFGTCLRGTRDQPRRMRMMGHNVWLIRWVAFILAGFWGSIAGLLYILDFQFISPQTLTLQQSAESLLMVILGGAGTLAGPIVGAIIITLVKTVVSTYVARWYTLLGLIFIGVELFMPLGLVPGCRLLWHQASALFGRTRP